jgi:hypothetical protein
MEYMCKTFLSTLYIGYHTLSLHKSAVHKLAGKLCLGNGSHMAFNFAFHSLSPEWILKRPGQLLLTYSAFQLAAEHMSESTD